MTNMGRAPHTRHADANVKREIERLRVFVEESFPADAVCIETAKEEELLRLARTLLERLWRSEN
jgi:hypothetical protein